jgi:hypothetical protein
MAAEGVPKNEADNVPIVNKFADDVPVTSLEVACAMRVSRWTVGRWKQAGYKFEFGRHTTLGHLKAWLRDQAQKPPLPDKKDAIRLEAALSRLR